MARIEQYPLEDLYLQMVRMRAFEETIGSWWREGLISGELHLGIGEEGIIAGVVSHLRDGDSMALDHRSTPPLVARGSDVRRLLLEMLGHPDGIGGGNAGHMHLFDRSLLAASTGIVGAGSPTACGFALAHRQHGTEGVSVCFFGESAMNQGMVMESLNLAVVWNLPVVFVIKDNGWAISTRSSRMTAGDLLDRAQSFEMPAHRVDGSNVAEVWTTARTAIERARRGNGPSCLLATCFRPRGHFEDDPLIARIKEPTTLARDVRRLMASAFRSGEPLRSRLGGIGSLGRTIATATVSRLGQKDPITKTAKRIDDAEDLNSRARAEIAKVAQEVLSLAGVRP